MVLHEHGQVAHRARWCRDPLGHLALEHEREAARSWLVAQDAMEHRARHVVGQVGDEVPTLLHEVRQVEVEDIPLHEPQAIDAREALPRWA